MKKVVLLLTFIAFIIPAVFAQTVITNESGPLLLGKQCMVLTSDKELNLQEALASQSFVKVDQNTPNLGIQKNNVWIKFSFRNMSDVDEYLLDVAYPILDTVVLYELDGADRVINVTRLGEGVAFKDRKYDNPNFIFDLKLPQGSTKSFLLKIKSTEQIIVPIRVSTALTLNQRLSTETMLSSIFIGIILIMFFYNLFLYFSVKDISYIYYVIYVIFVGLTQLGIKGLTYQYLWPESPAFQMKSVVVFACISCIATIYFSKNFLHLKQYLPKSVYVVNFLLILFVAGIVFTMLGYVQLGFQIMLSSTSIEALVLITVSLLAMFRGVASAVYFFAAWSVLLLGSIIFLMKDYGVLPYNYYTSYSVQAASAVEMALLSFGLANRINILKREKEQSQLAALNAAKENERIISEQNVMLEEKVAVRTLELQETNEALSSTLVELKEAQSQLVESEKMASLGQLTAGIAHEINNPINFVTSNVAPLKRDIAMVYDTVAFMEQHLNDAALSTEEKIQKIAEFKEDLDYDYLKDEIEHLLNGIYEGSSRTAEIVKGLRIFSRVDESDLKIANINDGLDSTLIIVNNLLNSSIIVDKKYDLSLPQIECYPGKLNQVFLNMVSNAIHAIRAKFQEKSGGVLTLETRTLENEIQVIIEDNGIGMDEVTQHKIYEPFFTTKDVGEGTGLGMSIVYNTIKKHDGKIELHSELGSGTRFTISLPKVLHIENL